MGGMFGGGPKIPEPVAQGPSATEIRLEKEALEAKAKEEERKKEEAIQRSRNKRGRRSLLAPDDTGSGFSGPDVGV
jgi:hypothetical protein